jgi:hypothetical protein
VKELVERHGIFSFTGGVSSAGGNAVKGYLAENKILWVTPGSAAVNSDSKGEIETIANPYRYYSYPLFRMRRVFSQNIWLKKWDTKRSVSCIRMILMVKADWRDVYRDLPPTT